VLFPPHLQVSCACPEFPWFVSFLGTTRRGFGPTCDLNSVTHKGWLFFLPVVPLTGEHVRDAVNILSKVSQETGISIGATINVLSPSCVDLVTSLHFSTEPETVKQAHYALDRLHVLCRERGFFSYRWVPPIFLLKLRVIVLFVATPQGRRPSPGPVRERSEPVRRVLRLCVFGFGACQHGWIRHVVCFLLDD
jgi:hypothetical protein